MIAVWTHRERMVLVVAVMAIAGVLFDRAIALRMRYAQALGQNIVQDQMELRLGRRLLSAKDMITRSEQELGLKPDGAAELSDVPTFLSEIDQDARTAGVTVVSLRPGSGGEGIHAAMSLNGDWQALARFFSSVQSKPRFLDIQQLRIENKVPQDKTLRLECVLGRGAR